MDRLELHLDRVRALLTAIHRRAGRAKRSDNATITNVELDEIQIIAYDACGEIQEAREAAKPWWRRFL